MKLAILYICTGKYNIFFKDFYNTSEKYLLSNIVDKEYFVWTDDLSLCKEKNVHLIKKECAGFPKDSLFRFDMFLQKKEELKCFDYIYFFNSNAKFLQNIGCEILPSEEDGYLVGAQWPGKRKPYNCPMFFPYERKKTSTAYIAPHNPPYFYFMGGINGGRANEYIQMIETLSYNIQDDFKRGIIAYVHDESHINKYFRSHKCKILTQEYCWPEEWKSDFTPKIIFRDKVRLDKYFDKGRNHSLLGNIKKGIDSLYRALTWYM